METKKKKEYEIVADFKSGNCHFVVKQPKNDSTPEELESFYIAMGKMLYSKRGNEHGEK